jgi:hypothetical protein
VPDASLATRTKRANCSLWESISNVTLASSSSEKISVPRSKSTASSCIKMRRLIFTSYKLPLSIVSEYSSLQQRQNYYFQFGAHTHQEAEISLADTREISDKFTNKFDGFERYIAFFAISLISGNICPSPARRCRSTDDEVGNLSRINLRGGPIESPGMNGLMSMLKYLSQ